MNNDQFLRYKTLDRCFRLRFGSKTIDELTDVCSSTLSNHYGEDRKVSRRTIEKDLQDLRDIYGVKFVKGLKDGKKMLYQYEDTSFSLMKEILADGNLEKQLLQNVLDMLQCYEDVPQYKWLLTFLQERIAGICCNAEAVSFQNNPDLLGMEYFPVLMDCIVRKKVIKIDYHPFQKQMRSLIVSPYQLKQFNNRWYLICKEAQNEIIFNLPLDRIEGDIEITETQYLECPIDLDEYYEDVVGVTVHPGEKVVDVLLRVRKTRYGYIATKPLHSSQVELHKKEEEKHVYVKLHVRINNELEARILSFGNDVEVLEPITLRKRIARRTAELYSMYNSL